MDQPNKPTSTRRHDGWTPERRARFLEALAEMDDVRRACGFAGMSRQGAYGLRRRDDAFARQWDAALRTAREARRTAFLAALPQSLLRTMSEMSGL